MNEDKGKIQGSPKRSILRVRSCFLSAGLFLVAASSIFGFLGRLGWFFELFSHFRVQYFILLMVASVFYAVRKRLIAAGIFLILAASNAALFVPVYFGKDAPAPQGRTLRLISANIHVANRRTGDVLKFITEIDADIVVLFECDRFLDGELGTPSNEYRLVRRAGRRCTAVAVLSRIRPVRSKVIYPGGIGWPSVTAEFEIDGERLTLIAAHPPPPSGPGYARDRNAQLEELARLARKSEGEVIVIGDLNCTPYAPSFADLRTDSGLRDSRRGFGLQPTWPTFMPVFYIPIDHCLVSEGVAVVERRTGPRIGSDHLPIIVEVSLK